MPERLVDVETQGSKVLHTFPVTVPGPAVEEAFKEKALEAAGSAKLVPNEDLGSLNAKMHISRGGQLTPNGDPHGVLAETKAGLDQVVRERAYLLWEQAGRPEGCADNFWHEGRALVADPRLRGELGLAGGGHPPNRISDVIGN